MAKPRINSAQGIQAVEHVMSQAKHSQENDLATAVRYLLQIMRDTYPGTSVELRVPPYGAIQCVEGPVHTRGTPANVVEMSPETWVALATGTLTWDGAISSGVVSASGVRSDIGNLLPLAQWSHE